MTALPTAIRHLLITLGLVVGLVAATGGVASAATPTLPGGAPSVAAGVTQPTWNNDNRDRRDRGRDNRGHDNGGWRGGWHPRWWAVSTWQCRKGHGHVDWRHDRCWGGWFSGAHIRRW